ncbi:hypothetical protein C0Q70_12079 [Pomacea canaliculata]|uniref:Uncharacterized protein n=1 Tax=Pomacea canaliculata TaxID=400727 RepID=A0A2T7P0I5_POMCA|nr:hypothetical protein C0Q70_12079 [Pomacea canaliculata]
MQMRVQKGISGTSHTHRQKSTRGNTRGRPPRSGSLAPQSPGVAAGMLSIGRFAGRRRCTPGARGRRSHPPAGIARRAQRTPVRQRVHFDLVYIDLQSKRKNGRKCQKLISHLFSLET